jgi:hypothetical protein
MLLELALALELELELALVQSPTTLSRRTHIIWFLRPSASRQ